MTRPNEANAGGDSRLDPAVSRWLDGASETDEGRRIEARVAADPALSAEVVRLRTAMDAFRDDVAGAPPPSRDLAARVLAAAARGDAEEARFVVLARRYAAAAAVLLAVGVGGTVLVRRDEPGAPSAPPTLADLEDERMASEQFVTLDQHDVGGR